MVVINLSTYMIRETEDDILLMDHTLQERDYASMPNNAADVSFTIQVFSSSLRQGSRADPEILPASKAAELLMDIRTPCLISEGNKGEEETDNYIVTPWDVVMKTLKSESTPIITN